MSKTESRRLPKSLHTITVLVNFALCICTTGSFTAEEAIDTALDALGFDGADDPYELRAKALAQLTVRLDALEVIEGDAITGYTS